MSKKQDIEQMIGRGKLKKRFDEVPGLEEIASGIYVTDATKAIVPSPSHLKNVYFKPDIFGQMELSELAAVFVYVSREHHRWVGMSADRLTRQIIKHITNTQKIAERYDSQKQMIQQAFLSGDFYPSPALASKEVSGKAIGDLIAALRNKRYIQITYDKKHNHVVYVETQEMVNKLKGRK